jgi:signal transduction histidine kinase
MDEAGQNPGPPPAPKERHQRATLADAITSRMDDIEERWLARVREEITARGRDVAQTDLKNAIGEYLAGLASALRGDETVERGGTSAWVEVAREHALTRVRLGFDVDQLVREFIQLRRVLFEVAREEGLISSDLQAERLADLIEAAIATAVRSYVESRDVAARRAQAEHIGFLTHELRNPLSTATLAALHLRRRPAVVADAQDTLDVLDRGLSRMAALIDGILLTQRMDARQLELQPAQLSLESIIPDATRAAEMEAKRKGLTFEADYDPETVVQVDPGLTASALQNIADNAVKFTDEGTVRLIADGRESEVVIHVYDNCGGLSSEELATIFEPFKRGHQGKTGSGLGLAIARRAIEAQGGHIGADSGDERGCHFWLTLPRPPH